MKVVVDLSMCDLHGLCVDAAPEVFQIGDDGVLHVLLETPADGLRASRPHAPGVDGAWGRVNRRQAGGRRRSWVGRHVVRVVTTGERCCPRVLAVGRKNFCLTPGACSRHGAATPRTPLHRLRLLLDAVDPGVRRLRRHLHLQPRARRGGDHRRGRGTGGPDAHPIGAGAGLSSRPRRRLRVPDADGGRCYLRRQFPPQLRVVYGRGPRCNSYTSSASRPTSTA